MSNKGLEILSPAGNLDIFKKVIDAGADAVYFGGMAFGARAYAKNFDEKEIEEAVAFAHSRGKKAYLTVNTLLKSREIEDKLYKYLKQVYELGIDAVIVQDMGVFMMAKDHFPDLKIHASTQMNTSSAAGAFLLGQMGADRIVTGRELSLSELREIYDKTGIEIECFVHGALCICYSGQCLMSSIIGGRSGNRGRCAQPCRLNYSIWDDNDNRLKTPGDYVLSPKDLCGIDHIPVLSEAGVYSLKIEGRMKQAAYAAGVTAIYKKYVDMYLSGGAEKYRVSKSDREALLALGNRNGFTDSYYFKHNDPDMISYITPAHKHNDPKGAKIETRVYKDELSVSLHKELLKERREGSLMAYPYLYTDILKEQDFSKENAGKGRTAQNTAYEGNRDLSDKTLYKRLIVSVSSAKQAYIAAAKPYVSDIFLDSGLALSLSQKEWHIFTEKLTEAGKVIGLSLPEILRSDVIKGLNKIWKSHRLSQCRYYMANNFDSLGFLSERGINGNRIIAGERLYRWSGITGEAYDRQGIGSHILPFELNKGELKGIRRQDSVLTVYGYIPMMITANCLHKNTAGCDKKACRLYLTDRMKHRLPVINKCEECYNIIYNYLPMSLFPVAEELGDYEAFRIMLTIEDERETEKVLEGYEKAFYLGNYESDMETTYGHYKRGVE